MIDRSTFSPFKLTWPRLSIVVKLSILYGILIALFVSALGAASYFGAVRIMNEEASANARLAIEQVRNAVDSTLEEIDKDSYIIFSNPEILRALKSPRGLIGLDGRFRYAVDKLITDVAFSNDAIDSLVLYDFVGGKIASSAMARDLPLVELGPPALLADGRFALVNYDESKELFRLVRLIRDMEMKPVGYLRTDARGNAFRRAFPNELLDMGSAILVIDGNNIIVAEGVAVPQAMIEKVFAQKGKNGSLSVRFDNTDYAVSFFESRSYSWRIVGFVPSGRIGYAAGRLQNITGLASLITILAFVLVSLFIMRRFLSPIHRIADDMRIWDLNTKVNTERYGGTDEIAYLSFRFSEMMERIRTLVEQLVDEKSRLNRQELAALQAQINPHFLYNTLEIVNWMAIDRGAPEIAGIVRSLSEMMRYAVGNGQETAPVSEEVAYVERYISLQSYRFPNKFTNSINASDQALSCCMPKLCLQPIVENSVQHAFKGLRRKGKLSVELFVEKEALIARISDNGIGMDETTLHRLNSGIENDSNADPKRRNHTGIGVANVHHRLQLRYGPNYGLCFTSVMNEGTTCVLRMPAKAD